MADAGTRLPNCLVIGAPRCGTTTLYEGLRRHPAVFMTRAKEPSYFLHRPAAKTWTGPGDNDPIRHGLTNLGEYLALFTDAGDAAIVGEASVGYLSSAEAAAAVRDVTPDARLIVVLRNPADRAYSQYAQHVQQGREPLSSFEAAIAAEPERLSAGWAPFWGYVALGCYARQLGPWLAHFRREQIGIFFYDDLERDTTEFTRDVYRFLGIDPSIDPRLADNINASGTPRSRALHRFLTGDHPVKRALKPVVPLRARLVARNLMTRAANRNLVTPQTIARSTRRELLERYHDDIRELERISGRGLDAWLREPSR